MITSESESDEEEDIKSIQVIIYLDYPRMVPHPRGGQWERHQRQQWWRQGEPGGQGGQGGKFWRVTRDGERA